MNIIIIVLAVGITLAIGKFLILYCQRVRAKGPSRRDKSAHACLCLRGQLMKLNPDAAGVRDFVGGNQVWGVVMETGIPENTVTLVALADGTTSLYFSSGEGVIGGAGHETVRKAALRMSRIADSVAPSCSPATEFPFPVQGHTSFYILTKNGKVTASAPEKDLGELNHPMSLLFYAGQDVITQLRLAT